MTTTMLDFSAIFVISEHPDLKILLPELRTGILKMIAVDQGKDADVVSPSEQLAYEIFNRVAELENYLRSLRIALTGIQNEVSSEDPDVEQYRYHAENYLLRLTGVYDRACRFVGIVIGMTAKAVDKLGGNKAVNDHLKRQKLNHVSARLAEIDNLLKPHRDTRNLVAHATEFSTRELAIFGNAEFLELQKEADQYTEMKAHHFRKGATDLGLLTLQLEALLYKLIGDLKLVYRSTSC